MIPTADNPLILISRGKPPAMKNERQIFQERNDDGRLITRIGKTPGVSKFLRQTVVHFSEQMSRQGMQIIPEPDKVGVFCYFAKYLSPKSKLKLAVWDIDNAYTTMQEALQGVVIENDRQIMDIHITSSFISSNLEYTVMCVWKIKKNALEDFATFFTMFGSKSPTDIIKTIR